VVQLEEIVRTCLDEKNVFVLKRCLRMVELLDEELKELDARIYAHGGQGGGCEEY